MNILIADDEVSFVEFLSERLIRKGNNVSCAYDGLSAVKMIENGPYDLVFLDHNMPGLTGLEVVKYIKSAGLDMKTVMVTGYQEMSERFMKTVGVDEYLTKPVHLADIDSLLEKYSKK